MNANWWKSRAARGTSGDIVYDILGDFERLENCAKAVIRLRDLVTQHTSSESPDYAAFRLAHEEYAANIEALRALLKDEAAQ